MSGSVDSVSARATQGNTRFRQSLNLNKAFKSTAPPHKTGPASRNGLQVLGGTKPRLQSSLVAAPKPVDIPSLRRENAGLDPTVNLVPSGGSGWATRSKDISDASIGFADDGGSGSDDANSSHTPAKKSPRNWAVDKVSAPSSLSSSPDFPTAAEAMKNAKLDKKDAKDSRSATPVSANGIKPVEKVEAKVTDNSREGSKSPRVIPSPAPTKIAWQIPAGPRPVSLNEPTDPPPTRGDERDHTWVDDDDDMDFSKVPVFHTGVDGVEVIEGVQMRAGASPRTQASQQAAIGERVAKELRADVECPREGKLFEPHPTLEQRHYDRNWHPQHGRRQSKDFSHYHDRRRGSYSQDDPGAYGGRDRWKYERPHSAVERDERNTYLTAHPPQLLQRAPRVNEKGLQREVGNVEIADDKQHKVEDAIAKTVDGPATGPNMVPVGGLNQRRDGGDNLESGPATGPNAVPLGGNNRRRNSLDQRAEGTRYRDDRARPQGPPELKRYHTYDNRDQQRKPSNAPELKRRSTYEDGDQSRRGRSTWRPKGGDHHTDHRGYFKDERANLDRKERDLTNISWRREVPAEQPSEKVVAILQPERKPAVEDEKMHTTAPVEKEAASTTESRESQDASPQDGKISRASSNTPQALSIDAFDSVMTNIKQLIDDRDQQVEQAESDTTLADVPAAEPSPSSQPGQEDQSQPSKPGPEREGEHENEKHQSDRQQAKGHSGDKGSDRKGKKGKNRADWRPRRDSTGQNGVEDHVKPSGRDEKKSDKKSIGKDRSEQDRKRAEEEKKADERREDHAKRTLPAPSDKPSVSATPATVDASAPSTESDPQQSRKERSVSPTGSPTFTVAIPPEVDMTRKMNFFAMPDLGELDTESQPASASVQGEAHASRSQNVESVGKQGNFALSGENRDVPEAWSMLHSTPALDVSVDWQPEATLSTTQNLHHLVSHTQPMLVHPQSTQAMLLPGYPVWPMKDSSPVTPELLYRQMMAPQMGYPWMVVPGTAAMQAKPPAGFQQVVRPAGPPLQVNRGDLQAMFKEGAGIIGVPVVAQGQGHVVTRPQIALHQQNFAPSVGRFERQRHPSAGKPIGYGRTQAGNRPGIVNSNVVPGVGNTVVRPVGAREPDSVVEQKQQGQQRQKDVVSASLPSSVESTQNSLALRDKEASATPLSSANDPQAMPQQKIEPTSVFVGSATTVKPPLPEPTSASRPLTTPRPIPTTQPQRGMAQAGGYRPHNSTWNANRGQSSYYRRQSYGFQSGPYWQARQGQGRGGWQGQQKPMAGGRDADKAQDVGTNVNSGRGEVKPVERDNGKAEVSTPAPNLAHKAPSGQPEQTGSTQPERTVSPAVSMRIEKENSRPGRDDSSKAVAPVASPTNEEPDTSKPSSERRPRPQSQLGSLSQSQHGKKGLKRPASTGNMVGRDASGDKWVPEGRASRVNVGRRASLFKEDVTPSGLKVYTHTSRPMATTSTSDEVKINDEDKRAVAGEVKEGGKKKKGLKVGGEDKAKKDGKEVDPEVDMKRKKKKTGKKVKGDESANAESKDGVPVTTSGSGNAVSTKDAPQPTSASPAPPSADSTEPPQSEKLPSPTDPSTEKDRPRAAPRSHDRGGYNHVGYASRGRGGFRGRGRGFGGHRAGGEAYGPRTVFVASKQ